jgi:hypothetical protein
VLTWSDGSIVNRWVKITTLAGGQTGLASDDVFYFGNAVGDVDGDGLVDDTEYDTLVSQFGMQGGIGALASDFDGDGFVSLGDFVIVRNALGSEVQSPTVPAPAPPSPLAAAPLAAPGLVTSVNQSPLPESPANTPLTNPITIAVDQLTLPSAQTEPTDDPPIERELYDALQGPDSIAASQTVLETGDILADLLAEAALAVPL